MPESRIMSTTINPTPVFPFVIEGEEITNTLGLNPDDIAMMLSAGNWNLYYSSADPAVAERALIFDGPNVVVTQVATTTDRSLAFAIVGTRSKPQDWVYITYRPQGWRKVTAAGFYKDRNGKLWMAGGYYDPTIQVLSACI